jgi:hypothetical protein
MQAEAMDGPKFKSAGSKTNETRTKGRRNTSFRDLNIIRDYVLIREDHRRTNE